MPWPADGNRYYHLHCERDSKSDYRAFITVQTFRARGGRAAFFRDEDKPAYDDPGCERALSRLALRLDLHQPFRTREQATKAAYEAAHRFAAGQLSAPRYEMKERRGDYQLIAGAGYRPDTQGWEGTLVIKRKSGPNKGAVQTFEENTSPFRFNSFDSADGAAKFAFDYGERMLLNLVSGLKI